MIEKGPMVSVYSAHVAGHGCKKRSRQTRRTFGREESGVNRFWNVEYPVNSTFSANARLSHLFVPSPSRIANEKEALYCPRLEPLSLEQRAARARRGMAQWVGSRGPMYLRDYNRKFDPVSHKM